MTDAQNIYIDVRGFYYKASEPRSVNDSFVVMPSKELLDTADNIPRSRSDIHDIIELKRQAAAECNKTPEIQAKFREFFSRLGVSYDS